MPFATQIAHNAIHPILCPDPNLCTRAKFSSRLLKRGTSTKSSGWMPADIAVPRVGDKLREVDGANRFCVGLDGVCGAGRRNVDSPGVGGIGESVAFESGLSDLDTTRFCNQLTSCFCDQLTLSCAHLSLSSCPMRALLVDHWASRTHPPPASKHPGSEIDHLSGPRWEGETILRIVPLGRHILLAD
jgi:hypothetical protein